MRYALINRLYFVGIVISETAGMRQKAGLLKQSGNE